ncbi:HNH endonuclease family protein [Streptomyces sp. MB09-01]|uniref:HNH endonuclease family protein n=1 Tax=Streptomyces sp. MB09-01 TaxID=3028666 RepID=UPI0029C9EC06|nr:HNH endonuclease family protein [Streptomyces sp. MB09-01]
MIKNLRRGLMAAALTFAVLAPASPAQADEVPHGRDHRPAGRGRDPRRLQAGAVPALEGRRQERLHRPQRRPHRRSDRGPDHRLRLLPDRRHSYYDDVLVQGPYGVDIDHLIPLAEVHDSGGYGWTTERRRRYANDLGSDVTLVGVSARSNRQKSDQDPATWMPMAQVHCRYLGEWVATKHRWALAVDPAEREALLRYAADCPNARITYDPAA